MRNRALIRVLLTLALPGAAMAGPPATIQGGRSTEGTWVITTAGTAPSATPATAAPAPTRSMAVATFPLASSPAPVGSPPTVPLRYPRRPRPARPLPSATRSRRPLSRSSRPSWTGFRRGCHG